MALFSRDDRTFNLELVRVDDVVSEELHVGGHGPRRDRHADAAAALAAFRRRVVELVGEGWRLSLADDDLDHPLARDPALEDRIVAAGDAERAGLLAVYADWLGERGDPCGDLAALRARDERDHSGELGAAIQRLELARELDLFGLLRQLPDHTVIKPRWRDGWIDGYDVASSSGTLALLALVAPMARFVRALEFHSSHSLTVRAAIGIWPRRHQVRRLVMPHTSYGQELLEVLPGLDEVTMPAATRTHGHPTVRRLVLSVDTVRRGRLTGAWPNVREIVLRYRRGKRKRDVDATEVLHGAELPARPTVEIEVG